MRILALIISVFWFTLAWIVYVYFFSFINYVWGWKVLYNDANNFKKIEKQLQGKNYLQRNNKIYVVSNYIITPDTKISWVVEINKDRKSFKDLTLNKLKQYNNIWKIYITQIWNIVLQWSIILQWYKWGTILHWDVKEKQNNKTDKKSGKNTKK